MKQRILLGALAAQFLLLILCLWINRPLYPFVNRVYDPKAGMSKYAVCFEAHRWGKSVVCPSAPQSWTADYESREYMLFVMRQKFDRLSFAEKWKAQ